MNYIEIMETAKNLAHEAFNRGLSNKLQDNEKLSRFLEENPNFKTSILVKYTKSHNDLRAESNSKE